MTGKVVANFFERDLRRLIEEVSLFKNEENLWKAYGSVKNPAGNLALHVIGGSNYLFGAVVAKTGYVRNRPEEFTRRNVPRAVIITQLEELIGLVTQTVSGMDLEAEYPILFDDAKQTNGYVVVQLLVHLNYHLGQVNYLRRMLE